MFKTQQYRQRLNALFADLEQFAIDTACDMQTDRRRIEEMQTRLYRLEADLRELENRLEEPEPTPPATSLETESVQETTRRQVPVVYDKDWVGYAFSVDGLHPLHNPADVDSGIAAPLLLSGQSVGKVQVQLPSEQMWTEDEKGLLNMVAQQASVQIENLRLLEATERARAEAENATRRYIHESWDSFLDAIHQSERMGYAYDQASLSPFLAPPQVNGGVHEAVQVMDEHIGTLYLEPDPARPLTNEDRAVITSIANQVAQQLENLRLLADASRARAEAEDATRRVTRENWQAYAERHEDTLGFIYDSNQVRPLTDAPVETSLSQPLIIQGEPIGQLAIAGMENATSEMTDLLSAIAAQASLHLETLRLNEELQKRARELQELDRLKSAFLANMSHELRTPLNSILGFADVILEGLDGPLTENMDNDLRLIQKNGQHLLHLINDVLDMAKIESGRMNLHPEKFRVHDVFVEVTSITSTLADDRGTALIIDGNSDRELEIFADNTRFRQVMINLVNNAIKFTEKGTIMLAARHLEGDRALITVKDSGIGIPPDKLESIFQEFTQVDTSTTRKAGGTGLGLPISRRLVEMHGGRLWAESTGTDGEGATFFVEMPLEARIAEGIEKKER